MPGTNPFITSAAPTAEQIRAANLAAFVGRLNEGGRMLLQSVVQFIKTNWEGVWENPEFTPAEVLAAMGTSAAETFRTAAILTAAVYQIGMEAPVPTDILPAKYLSAAMPCTVHEDGTVTRN